MRVIILSIIMSNASSESPQTPVNIRNNNRRINILIWLENPILQDYFPQQNENVIKYSGYIDEIKTSEIIRILLMNPKGCNPNNEEKIEILIESIKRLQLDVVLLNEVNTK